MYDPRVSRLGWLAAAFLVAGQAQAAAPATATGMADPARGVEPKPTPEAKRLPPPAPGTRARLFFCPLLGAPGAKPESISLNDELAAGRVVVLNFFSPGCAACAPAIRFLKRALEGRDRGRIAPYLVLVTLESEDDVRGYLRRNEVEFPVLVDRQGSRIGERYRVVQNEVARVPQTAVIGPDGLIKMFWMGARESSSNELATLLDGLVPASARPESPDSAPPKAEEK